MLSDTVHRIGPALAVKVEITVAGHRVVCRKTTVRIGKIRKVERDVEYIGPPLAEHLRSRGIRIRELSQNGFPLVVVSFVVVKIFLPLDRSYYDGDSGSSPDVIMKIAAAGDYRVKGTFNEQNSAQIKQGAKVFLRSRIDESLVLRGTVSEIDTSPQNDNNQNMYYGYGMSDEMSSSAKYTFYVEPESLEGFMLGQHILIEMDNGQDDENKKEGLWLYSSFVLWDGDRNYVWAKNGRDQIEKRYVEVGQINDESGDCEILSGLTIDDYIAYPADYIAAGLSTTTNQSDKNIPENVLNGINDQNGMEDMPDMPEMQDMQDMEGMDDADLIKGMEENGGDGNVSVDEDGNTVIVNEDGSVTKFDQEGNLIGDGSESAADASAEDAAPADDAAAE